MKIRKLTALLLALVLVFALAACGTPEPAADPAPAKDPAPAAEPEPANEPEPAEEPEPANEPAAEDPFGADAPAYELSCGYEGAEDEGKWQCATHFAELVSEYTNGKVKVTLYPNGVYGTTADEAASVMAGDLNMFWGEANSSVSEKLSIFDAPALFSNVEKAYEVFTSDNAFTDTFESTVEALGMKNLMLVPIGGRIVGSTKEISSPEDFKGLIVRCPPNGMIVSFFNALGGTGTIISGGETYLAMQNKMADALDQSLDQYVSTLLYEVTDYLYLTYHIAAKEAVYINNDLFNSMPEAYQEALLKAGKDTAEFTYAHMQDYYKGIFEFLNEEGVTVVECDWSEEFYAAATDLINNDIRPLSGDAFVDAALDAMGMK